jgi:hypothetical protein
MLSRENCWAFIPKISSHYTHSCIHKPKNIFYCIFKVYCFTFTCLHTVYVGLLVKEPLKGIVHKSHLGKELNLCRQIFVVMELIMKKYKQNNKNMSLQFVVNSRIRSKIDKLRLHVLSYKGIFHCPKY